MIESSSKGTLILLWGIPLALVAVGIISDAARPLLWSVGFLWMGAGCVANAVHCGRMHCVFTGPLYLIVGALSVGNAFSLLSIDWGFLGSAALIGTGVAFLPEWLWKKYLPG